MKKLVVSTLLISYSLSFSHFLVVKTDKISVIPMQPIKVETYFSHPAEGYPNMNFTIEKSFMVRFFRNQEKIIPIKNWQKRLILAMEGTNLKAPLYETLLNLPGPGIYQIVIEQVPYWEEGENLYIQQIAKVFISACGIDRNGWEKPVGLPVEIVPLVSPLALWKGNVFVGQVLVNGKPAENITVEVEYLNNGSIEYPSPLLTTQILKTDENGYFYYAFPFSGWWGFSAITEIPQGYKGKTLELDGVIWLYVYPTSF
jgi:cobalt/nickel transport protein